MNDGDSQSEWSAPPARSARRSSRCSPSASFPPARWCRSRPSARPGQARAVRGGEIECRPLSDEAIAGLDLVLSSAGGAVSSEWAPRLVEAGAVVVDNTSYWRMHDDVPLVVAEVNPDAAEGHSGLVANPNCTTMQLMVALAPIQRAAGIERLVVSTYQSVSGTGREAIEELRGQSRACSTARRPRPRSIPHRSPSTSCPRSRPSWTATTTRPRSAR